MIALLILHLAVLLTQTHNGLSYRLHSEPPALNFSIPSFENVVQEEIQIDPSDIFGNWTFLNESDVVVALYPQEPFDDFYMNSTFVSFPDRCFEIMDGSDDHWITSAFNPVDDFQPPIGGPGFNDYGFLPSFNSERFDATIPKEERPDDDMIGSYASNPLLQELPVDSDPPSYPTKDKYVDRKTTTNKGMKMAKPVTSDVREVFAEEVHVPKGLPEFKNPEMSAISAAVVQPSLNNPRAAMSITGINTPKPVVKGIKYKKTATTITTTTQTTKGKGNLRKRKRTTTSTVKTTVTTTQNKSKVKRKRLTTAAASANK